MSNTAQSLPNSGPTSEAEKPTEPVKKTPEIAKPCVLGTTFHRAATQATPDAVGGAGGLPLLLDGAARLGAAALYLVADGTGAALAAQPQLIMERRLELPVVGLDAALGAVRLGQLRAHRAQAASLDRAEAEAAVAVVKAALAFAEELGARYVVTSLGQVRGLERLWRPVRGRFLRGVLLYNDESAQALMEIRAGVATHHLDAGLRSVDRMAEEAARRGITLLLRNPRSPLEMPLAMELAVVRAELRGAPLAPLLDLPAAHLTSTLRCVPLRETVLAFGDGPLASLADACSTLSGLVPGTGEVDVAAVARALGKSVQRLFIPWPGLTLPEVEAGYRSVAAL